MKIELELSDEAIKLIRKGGGFSTDVTFLPISKLQYERIKAALPPEQKKFKFLVGYINPQGACANEGELSSNAHEIALYPQKIYGHSQEMLKAMLIELIDYAYVSWRIHGYIGHDPVARDFLNEYLCNQEAK